MKKKFFTGLFIFAAIGLFIFAYIVLRHNDDEYYEIQENLNAPIEITSERILRVNGITSYTDIKKPVVLLFYVDWCTYCRRFMPIYSELAEKYKDKYIFAAANCDIPQNRILMEPLFVRSYPTLIIIDNQLDFEYQLSPILFQNKEILEKELDKFLKLKNKVQKQN